MSGLTLEELSGLAIVLPPASVKLGGLLVDSVSIESPSHDQSAVTIRCVAGNWEATNYEDACWWRRVTCETVAVTVVGAESQPRSRSPVSLLHFASDYIFGRGIARTMESANRALRWNRLVALVSCLMGLLGFYALTRADAQAFLPDLSPQCWAAICWFWFCTMGTVAIEAHVMKEVERDP